MHRPTGARRAAWAASALVAGGLLAVAAWWLLRPAPDGVASVRTGAATPQPEGSSPGSAPAPYEPVAEGVLVEVTLVPPDWDRVFAGIPSLALPVEPSEVLDGLPEAAWPAVPTIPALLAGVERDQEEAFLAQAARDGLTVEAALASGEPWHILAAAEVERIRSRRAARDARAAADAALLERHGISLDDGYPAEGDPAALEAYWAAYATARRATDDQVALAESLAGTPLADLGRLYRLEALADIDARGHDPAAARRLALELLDESDDAAVAHQALSGLLSVTRDDLDPSLLPSLAAWAEEFPAERPRLAGLAVETALRAGRSDLAGWWLERTLDLRRACPCTRHDVVEVDEAVCMQVCGLHDRVAPRLAATGLAPAATWVHRLEAAALACGKPFEASGTWNSAWAWTEVVGDAAAADCVARAATAPPNPPEGQAVRLRVVAGSTP